MILLSSHLAHMVKWKIKLLVGLSAMPLVIIMLSASCGRNSSGSIVLKDTVQPPKSFTLMFYNVENLFDIYDNPKTMDEDFTPEGKLNWTDERYQDKLFKIAEVVEAIPGELPAFVGLAEIENKKVLDELVKQNKLLSARYVVIHQDSPDERGIDVAALVDTSILKVDYFNYTRINLPDKTDPDTRELLYVRCKAGNEMLHYYVNHWPSRGGGQQESEFKRVAVANVLHSQVKKLLKANKDARIIIMGDFNDHPNDKSIANVLNAGTSKDSFLYNYMLDYHLAGKGSYWFKGEWGALDQFITSPIIKFGKDGYTAENASFFNDRMIMFMDSRGEQRPNRTYAGEKYTAGYSDHLPIYMQLTLR